MRTSTFIVSGSAIFLGFLISHTTPAQAANLVTYNFNVKLSSGALAGNAYSGSFTYNDAPLVGNLASGDPPIFVPVLDASFNFDGVNYTENNFTPGSEPKVKFIPSFSTEVFNLSWDYVNPAPALNSARGFQFLGFLNGPPGEFFYSYNPINDPNSGDYNGGYGTASFTLVSSQPIPEPMTILGTLLFGAGVGFKRFRKAGN